MSSPSPNNNGGPGRGSAPSPSTSGGAPSPSLSEYLAGLLKDKRQLMAFPGVFHHLDRILEDEIASVRSKFFQAPAGPSQPLELPTPEGEKVALQEKLFVPAEDHPDFNFIGRILGPRGMTLKKLEQETGCKIMIRGKGSTRDKRREDINRGKPNWEHLTEELHVLVSVEDTENRAQPKLDRAVEEVKKLLVPSQDNGDDELKKRQLMELAIINGTYRDTAANKVNEQPHHNPNIPNAEAAMLMQLMQAAGAVPQHAPPGHMNIPQHMMLPPGMQLQAGQPTTIHQVMHSMPPPLVTHADLQNQIMYAPAYGEFNPAAQRIDFATALAMAQAQHQHHRQNKHLGHRSGPY